MAEPLTPEHDGWHESGCSTCTALDPLLVALNDIDHVDGAERDLIVRLAGVDTSEGLREAAEWLDWWDAGGHHEAEAAVEAVEYLRTALLDSDGQDGLDEAWAEAEAALGPNQRLVMWQDHEGPRYIQVLAPEKATDDDGEEIDDVMAPVISILVDYPSKGLGTDPTTELRALAARLKGDSDGG